MSSLRLPALLALVVAASSCDCGSAPAEAGCSCAADAECGANQRCDGCFCLPPCAGNEDCGGDAPNCDSGSGHCFGPCAAEATCVDPARPVCNPVTRLCQGPCPDEPCPLALPNCDPGSGLCLGACPAVACPDAARPNCDADGSCFGPCAAHGDCRDPAHPSCELDPASPDAGLCEAPCASDADCTSAAFPACSPESGTCDPACASSADCPAGRPNCDPAAGRCVGPCPATPCPDPALPNCGADGSCFAPCASPADCPQETPNCDAATGGCYGPCTSAADCTVAAAPVCDPAGGLCQAPCPGTPCPAALPLCDPAGGSCLPACTGNADCPDPAAPNCGAAGTCFGPCASHGDCANPALPSCELDPASASAGECQPPCRQNADCEGSFFPNCDVAGGGVCLPPCAVNLDCPGNQLCEPDGLCAPAACAVDVDCNPPATVCEGGRCVPGCATHADCAAAERCRLGGAEPGHCEPRDCLGDADCSPPVAVCDTDGLRDPAGGGFCVAGCQGPYDCPAAGNDCSAATGACSPHDYGDVGVACNNAADCTNCGSGKGVPDAAGVMVCTDFCCVQHDCPAGYGCRAIDDGNRAAPCDGGGCRVDLCAPLEPANGGVAPGGACAADSDCRSNVCSSRSCRDTCCNDAGCPANGEHCGARSGGVTACLAGAPATDVGTTGCSTPPGAPTASCNSGMCFTLFIADDGCNTAADCPANYDNFCGDRDGEADANDCAYDFCVAHCRTTADCNPSATGRPYFCAQWIFGGAGDVDVCFLHPGTAVLAEGAACSANSECVSNFCNESVGLCRERCSVDADCLTPGFPRCTEESFSIYGRQRIVNVCTP